MKGNKYLTKKVKQYFRYGGDVVYVMNDESVIIKKVNGESLILNPDESVDVVDSDGKVKGKEDFRFKLS